MKIQNKAIKTSLSSALYLLGNSVLLIACGQNDPLPALRSPAQMSRSPSISSSQLKMIQSGDPGVQELGWAAIQFNLEQGASPTDEQKKAIQDASLLYPSLKAHQVISTMNPKKQNKNEAAEKSFALKSLERFQSNSIPDQFWAEEQKLNLTKNSSIYNYRDFLEGSTWSAPRSLLPKHPFQAREFDYQYFPQLHNTSLAINPGQISQSTQQLIQNQQQRSDGGWVSMRFQVQNEKIRTLTHEEALQNTSIQTLRKELMIQLKNALCIELTQKNIREGSGAYMGNGRSETKPTPVLTCTNFTRGNAPQYPNSNSSRYQFQFVGQNQTPKPGNYTNFQGTSSLLESYQWFSEAPSVSGMIEQNLNSKSTWFSVVPRNEGFQHPYPKIVQATCIQGCLFQDPILETKQSGFVFANNGSQKVQIKVESIIPLTNNLYSGETVAIHIDVVEPRVELNVNPLDPTKLLQSIVETDENDPYTTLALLSSSLQIGAWGFPEIGHDDISSTVSLSRLSLLKNILSTDSMLKSFNFSSNNREMHLSILSAHARSGIPMFKKSIQKNMELYSFLKKVEKRIKPAFEKIDFIHREDLEILLSSASTITEKSIERVLDRSELQEAIVGSWQIIQEKMRSIENSIQLLCSSLQAMSTSEEEIGSNESCKKH